MNILDMIQDEYYDTMKIGDTDMVDCGVML